MTMQVLQSPPPTPTHMEEGIWYLSQTESLNERKKAGFQVVNSALEPAVFERFTDALWAYAFAPASDPTSLRSKRSASP
jgi:hypothetical protein